GAVRDGLRLRAARGLPAEPVPDARALFRRLGGVQRRRHRRRRTGADDRRGAGAARRPDAGRALSRRRSADQPGGAGPPGPPRDPRVPHIDPAYKFDPETTRAILAGFAHDRRVMVQGYHGTGKSTHIEQVAARLNWPLIRVNLDSHVSRIDLVGKDAIVLKEGKQVTEFREGILPWALQRPMALVFDEYEAGRPDVMLVIQ